VKVFNNIPLCHWFLNPEKFDTEDKGGYLKMRRRKAKVVIGIIVLAVFSLLFTMQVAHAAVFYGEVVLTEVKSIQVRGDNGKVSVFWIGRNTHLTTRHPFIGDRVKITYIKDRLRRNAATRITILGR
jgi:hypothetical protein